MFKVPGFDEKGMWRVVFPADAKADPKDIFEESLVQRRVQGGVVRILDERAAEGHQRGRGNEEKMEESQGHGGQWSPVESK